jgi:sec-independent protein translocase protein TatA
VIKKYHQHLNLNHIYLVLMYGIHNAILQMPTGYEFLIIIVIIVVLFFGVKKIPELARSFGKAKGEYEKASIEAKKELDQIRGKDKVGREKLEEIAESLGIDYTNKNDDDLRKAIEGAVNKEKS